MTKHDQMMECMAVMEDGMTKVAESRDIWQNQLIWWICKAVYLLLERAVKGDKPCGVNRLKYRVPSTEEWMERYCTKKQLAGYEKRKEGADNDT